VNEPTEFVQVVRGSHPPLFVAHSLMSVQPAAPVPEYPGGHGPHENEPGVFVHVVSGSHPPLLVAHSLMSEQTDGDPVHV
jgi:hypothetical protein